MKLIASLAAATVVFGVASPAMAVDIDLFNEDQLVADQPVLIPGLPPQTAVIPQGSEIAAAVPGGFRDLWVENTTGGTQFASELRVENGLLSFNNGDNQAGIARITYDGQDSNIVDLGGVLTDIGARDTNKTGLGGYNPAGPGGDPTGLGFFFDITSASEGEIEFQATLTDMNLNEATFTETLTFINAGSVGAPNVVLAPGESAFLPFDIFSNASFFAGPGAGLLPADTTVVGTDVNVANLGSISFQITSNIVSSIGFDGSIDSITAVPLPASSLLLLGSVAGVFGAMGAASRRRRREEA